MKKLISRRSFLQGTGIAAAAAALTACGSSNNKPASTSGVASDTDYSDVLAEFDAPAAALENWAETYDPLIDQIRTETDFVKREALMHQAEDILMGTWCILPIYFYTDLYLQKDYISGIQSNVFGMKRFYYAKNANNNNTSINLCIGTEPDTLDPTCTTDASGGNMDTNMFLGLMNCDADGSIIPGCAADMPEVSEDALTYTFTLREGLKWSNGDKLDANDFVYSWNHVIDPNTSSDYSYLFDVIARNDDGSLKVEASADGLTLTVALIAPCPYFLDLCAFPTYFPVHQKSVEAANPDGSKPNAWAEEAGFVTNGAYTCTKWKHNESLTLTANPNYVFADDVTMPELNFMLNSQVTTVYSAYCSNNLDVCAQIPTEEIEALKQGTELHIDPLLGTYYAGCNANSEAFNAGRSLQQTCALRKALCLAIDRDYIIDTVAQGGQLPANCFVSDGVKDGHGGLFHKSDADYSYPLEESAGYFDTDAANNAEEITALLGAAGLSLNEDGTVSSDTPFSFEYLTNPGAHVAIAEAMQQDFLALGIDMSISTQEWKAFLDSRAMGNYDMARCGWSMDYNDPINELEMWQSTSGMNDCQFGR